MPHPLFHPALSGDSGGYLFTPGYGEQERRQLTLIFDRDEIIEIIKHNIVADDTSTTKNDSKIEAAEK